MNEPRTDIVIKWTVERSFDTATHATIINYNTHRFINLQIISLFSVSLRILWRTKKKTGFKIFVFIFD